MGNGVVFGGVGVIVSTCCAGIWSVLMWDVDGQRGRIFDDFLRFLGVTAIHSSDFGAGLGSSSGLGRGVIGMGLEVVLVVSVSGSPSWCLVESSVLPNCFSHWTWLAEAFNSDCM